MKKQPGDVSWRVAGRSGKPRSAWWAGWPWLAAILALVLIPLGGRRWIDGHRGGRGATATVAPPQAMPASIPRLEWQAVEVDAITSATDFALAGDTLLILDALSQRVVLLHLEGDAWRRLLSVGRRGGGPGEFLRPRSLALVDDSAFAVLEDDGRLQFFGRDASHWRTEIPSLPCPMFAPALIFAPDGRRFAAGNCSGPGPSRDTIFSALFERAAPAAKEASATAVKAATQDIDTGDTTENAWREVERVPRIALDLTWGSTFATLHPLSRHGDVLYFGTGVDGCLTRLALRGSARPAVTQVDECDLVAELFHVEPPAQVVANQREARRRGDRRLERAIAWPEVMPAFFGIIPVGDSLLLARPISADSLAFVPAINPFRTNRVRLVAPMSSFVSCTNGGCLWYDAEKGAIALVRFGEDGGVIQSTTRSR